MKVWLINPYGPIPGEGWRDYRFTMLGEALAKRGHSVIWWTANFSHHFKRFRSEKGNDIVIRPGFRIRLVPTTAYYRNIGFSRIRFEATFAWKLYSLANRTSSRPDCIIAADPPQSAGYVGGKLASHYESILILDVMDLWPELFILAFPRWIRKFVPWVLTPLYGLRRNNLRKADAVTTVCNSYLDLVRKEAPNLTNGRSSAIYIGIDVAALRKESLENDEKGKLELKMGKGNGYIFAIYAGTLGNNYDIDTLLRAASLLAQRGSKIKILVAGEGPLSRDVMEYIKVNNLKNLSYLGKLNTEYLARLFHICDVGLCTYSVESTVAMPVKVYDYMAVGLPIVNSLKGELENFIRDKNIGVQYSAGNPVSLVDALESLARDSENRSVMAQNSYNAALEFDQHVQYQKYIEFVEDLGVNKK